LKYRSSGSENRKERNSFRSINEHKRKRFPGSLSYLLIPLAGLAVAFFLFFSARDIFFSDKAPVYHEIKPEEKKADVAIPETVDIASPDKVTTSAVGDRTALATSEKVPVRHDTVPDDGKAGTSAKTTVAAPLPSKTISPVDKFQESDLWGIQIAMSASKVNSERLMGEVRKKGYNAQLTQPGDYYRIRVNGGSDRATAMKIGKMLESDGYDTLLVSGSAIAVRPSQEENTVFSKFQNDNTWGVQIGMFPVQADAMKLAVEVKKKGFNLEITKPGRYYRVRVKGGKTRATAEKIEGLLKKAGYDTLVVSS